MNVKSLGSPQKRWKPHADLPVNRPTPVLLDRGQLTKGEIPETVLSETNIPKAKGECSARITKADAEDHYPTRSPQD